MHIPYRHKTPCNSDCARLGDDGSLIKEYSVVALLGLTLVLFIFFMWVASRGMKSLKIVGSVAGIAMFKMCHPVCGDGGGAPAITEVHIATTNITRNVHLISTLMHYNTISMLVSRLAQRRFLLTLIKRATRKRISKKDVMPGGDGCGLCHSGLV